jgi:hypothetical protein
MAYLAVTDFKFGIDRRRPRVAGVPGTLYDLKNAVIGRGGDIERAKSFVATYTLPSSATFGLGQIRGQLYVFGSENLSASMPVGVRYQRLQSASGTAMTRVHSVKVFDSKFAVAAEFADGQIHYFYDGTRITAWDSIADVNASLTTAAEILAAKVNSDDAVRAISFGGTVLITAVVPGTAFTIAQSTVNGGAGVNDQTITLTQVQANVAAVAETRATGTITITGGSADAGTNTISAVTVDGVALISSAVDWTTSNSSTANALVIAINNLTSTSGYSASALGAVVTIQANPGTGATVNGDVIAVTTTGNVTTTDSGTVSGGITAVTAVAQVYTAALAGTYEDEDAFIITINGTDYRITARASGAATNLFVYKNRVYATASSTIRYCQINDPADWTDATLSSGAGFINVAGNSEGSERLQALAQYQTYVAVFTRLGIRLYTLETDAQENTFVQAVDGNGTIAPRSVTTVGNTDCFYLAETGIRSLKARDGINIAFVSDVGTLIDSMVREYRAEINSATVERSVGAVDPVDGRFWLAMGERIWVLSQFPASKISAWSYIEPGFTVTDIVVENERLWVRDDSTTIYLYGGWGFDEYPDAEEQEVTVTTPFMSAGKPATHKMLTGIDVMAEGEWDLYVLVDPNDPDVEEHVGRFSGSTVLGPEIGLAGRTPVFAIRMVCDTAGDASVSGLMVHYTPDDAG